MRMKNHLWIVALLLFGLAAAGPGALLAQPRIGAPGQPGGRSGDPLAGLKRALQQAGAPELTAIQEEQLKALITELRSTRQSQRPEGGPGSTKSEWDSAILAGDTGRAAALAATMAASMAEVTRARLETQASFAIQVLNVLRSNGSQLDLLLARFGTQGVVRLASSLGGGGRGGFGGPGPRGPGGND